MTPASYFTHLLFIMFSFLLMQEGMEHNMVVGARLAGLSISETAATGIFPTTISRITESRKKNPVQSVFISAKMPCRCLQKSDKRGHTPSNWTVRQQ